MQKYKIDIGVLTGTMAGAGIQHNPRFLAALVSAYNDYFLDHWVREYDCFKGSILVTPQDAEAAAREIHRLGNEDGVVQGRSDERREGKGGGSGRGEAGGG